LSIAIVFSKLQKKLNTCKVIIAIGKQRVLSREKKDKKSVIAIVFSKLQKKLNIRKVIIAIGK
jgi:hypothetical protein